jgi:uncharacterized membrane protein YoaK (UPF0700 family)
MAEAGARRERRINSFLAGMARTVVPGRDPDHGPLPPLLLVMTVVTGLVDAYSYLDLGHVFVANMTGNVVFLAFALVGSHGFSTTASLAALAAFGLGAAGGGRVAARRASQRARLLSDCATIQAVLVAISVALAAAAGNDGAAGYRYGLIVVLGVAMGMQNAAARKLAVPDLTTTVLTLTITGLAADLSASGRGGLAAGRRCLAVVAMFSGALVGAALIGHGQRVYPLAVALVVTAAVAGLGSVLGAGDPAWARPDG